MIRFHPIASADAAITYFSKSDGGYYTDGGLRQEWLGGGAKHLGLSGEPDFEHFKRLIHGLDPHTGEQLTAKLVDHRIPAWDVTASVPKGVTIALERGDSRIQDAIWDAARETMADLEGYATTRVRKGGQQDDRTTGNLVAFAVEHPETRPSKEDNMPDPDRHIHMVVMNLTYDPVEHEWKAVKFRPVMDLRKYFDHRFDMRLASKLADLGYGIDTKMKADERGGKRYFSWDIQGMPDSVVGKFSRRAGEVEALADALGVTNPLSKDKLGATSRQFKRKDLTLADCREYWDSKVTPEEGREVAVVIKAALLGLNPPQENTVEKAVTFALSDQFERRSVVKWTDLAIAAMERAMGGGRPEEVEPEAVRQGALLRNGEATTKAVLAEEARVIEFARAGKGTCRAMGTDTGNRPNDSPLSPEQAVMLKHVLTSSDRVVLVVGDAGTGKTHAVKSAFQRIERPVEIIAPGAEASRGVLRRDGFAAADTVTAFLNSPHRQQGVRGGVIWVDEAGQLPIRDLSRLVDVAQEQGARLVLQGDPKQHRSVARDGNMLRVLEQFAGLPVARLKDIRRQGGDYKQAVSHLADGEMVKGFDALDGLGWVKTVADDKPLVDAYLDAVDTKRPDQDVTDRVLAIAPTHAEADGVTAAIRHRLQERGIVGKDERTIPTLVPLHWTEARRGDTQQYDGTEVLQFHRNGGTFKAGDRVPIAAFKPTDRLGPARTFAVYGRGEVKLAAGDRIRITANGKTADGEHKLNNGGQYQVKGFDGEGRILLTNGWALPADYGHLTHGYVATSHASQGKTVDRVLIAMGSESLPAINAEQLYVSVSRGRQQATVFTDVATPDLRDAIRRADARKSATELMTPKPQAKRRRDWWLVRRARAVFQSLRGRAGTGMPEQAKQREYEYAR